MIDQQFQSW